MPSWIANDPKVVYIILGAMAVTVLAVGWMAREQTIALGSTKDRRKTPRTISVAVLMGLIALLLFLLAGGVALIDHLVVSDEEQIIQAIEDMADGVKNRDTEQVFRNVSKSFRSPGQHSMKDFKEFARNYIDHGQVSEVKVWDIDFPEEVSAAKGTAKVVFFVKVKGSVMGTAQDLYYFCEATFQFDSDRRWRLKGFLLKNPSNMNDIIPVPY